MNDNIRSGYPVDGKATKPDGSWDRYLVVIQNVRSSKLVLTGNPEQYFSKAIEIIRVDLIEGVEVGPAVGDNASRYAAHAFHSICDPTPRIPQVEP